MAQQCVTCAHPALDEINIALASGPCTSALSERFGVGQDALRRHRRAHLTPALVRVAATRRNEGTAISAHDRLESLYDRIDRYLDRIEAKGGIQGVAAVLAECRRTLETIAKMQGELDERPTTTVNLLSSPAVTELMGRLLMALQPFPEARQAASAVIDVEALEVPR